MSAPPLVPAKDVSVDDILGVYTAQQAPRAGPAPAPKQAPSMDSMLADLLKT